MFIFFVQGYLSPAKVTIKPIIKEIKEAMVAFNKEFPTAKIGGT